MNNIEACIDSQHSSRRREDHHGVEPNKRKKRNKKEFVLFCKDGKRCSHCGNGFRDTITTPMGMEGIQNRLNII